jgi:hypothetical protein
MVLLPLTCTASITGRLCEQRQTTTDLGSKLKIPTNSYSARLRFNLGGLCTIIDARTKIAAAAQEYAVRRRQMRSRLPYAYIVEYSRE